MRRHKGIRQITLATLMIVVFAQPCIAETNLTVAEEFIDAFYSFDATRIEDALMNAQGSAPSILYYQGWAEGGNYEIIERMPCVAKSAELINCSITVKDDLVVALETGFYVTDTFSISFTNGKIVGVETSSNDSQEYYDARDWVRKHRPELIKEPCLGYFDGGPTPGKCAQAMLQGYQEFVAAGKP
jgi:hypothetical protein